LIFHRHLKRKIDDLVMGMEGEAMKLVEFLHNDALPVVAKKTILTKAKA
jgi:hypothetical protein